MPRDTRLYCVAVSTHSHSKLAVEALEQLLRNRFGDSVEFTEIENRGIPGHKYLALLLGLRSAFLPDTLGKRIWKTLGDLDVSLEIDSYTIHRTAFGVDVRLTQGPVAAPLLGPRGPRMSTT